MCVLSCLPEMNMDLDLNPVDFQIYDGFGLDLMTLANTIFGAQGFRADLD